MNNKNAFKLLWTGISDWRYWDSPKHLSLFIHCIVNAFYKDVDGIKRGSFKTSRPKLAKEMGVSVRTLDALLHDLSTGDNPELKIYKDRGLTGYTMITVTEYNNYQDKNVQKLQVNDNDNVQKLQDNMQKLTQNTPSNMQKLTSKHATVAPYITCDNMFNNNNNNNIPVEGSSSSTSVEPSFEDLIQVYPKTNTQTAETMALFNQLNLEEKEKCIKFAKHLQLAWKQNGLEEKYKYIKSCHTFVKDKLFNGKVKDVLPNGIETTVREPVIDSREDPEFIAKFGQPKKPKTLAEKAEERIKELNNQKRK